MGPSQHSQKNIWSRECQNSNTNILSQNLRAAASFSNSCHPLDFWEFGDFRFRILVPWLHKNLHFLLYFWSCSCQLGFSFLGHILERIHKAGHWWNEDQIASHLGGGDAKSENGRKQMQFYVDMVNQVAPETMKRHNTWTGVTNYHFIEKLTAATNQQGWIDELEKTLEVNIWEEIWECWGFVLLSGSPCPFECFVQTRGLAAIALAICRSPRNAHQCV